MDSLQKLLNILAALSLSLSSVVGQNASDPSLFDNLFTGAPSASSDCHILSNPALLFSFVFSQIVLSDMIAVARACTDVVYFQCVTGKAS